MIPSEPTRRSLLSGAGLAATAGCTGILDTDAADGPAIRVTDAALTGSLLYFGAPDALSVAAPDETWFLWISLDGAGLETASPDDLRLRIDGDPRTWQSRYRQLYRDGFERQGDFDPDDWPNLVVFDAPADRNVDRLTLQADGERVASLPDVRARLSQPTPSTALDTADVPDAVAVGDPIEVRVAVENRADTDGTFRGAFNERDPYLGHAVTVAVPGNDHVEETVTRPGREGDAVEYRFVPAETTAESTVSLE
jgi:hypothetical protein